MTRRRHLWLAAILLSTAGPLHSDTKIHVLPDPPPASAPARAVRWVYRAIEARGLAALSWHLAEDFRFVSDDPDFLKSWPKGMDRAAELNFVKRLQASVPEARISWDDLVVDPPVTPMRAPSGTYYVRVKEPVLRFTDLRRGEVTAQSREHVFEVVCTPIRVAEGRQISSCRIRSWTEYSTTAAPVTVAAVDTSDTSALAARAHEEGPPAVFDLRVLSNGRRGVPSFSISLPAPNPARLEICLLYTSPSPRDS